MIFGYKMKTKKRVVIVGGGAAGIFASAVLAEKAAGLEIIVLEKTRQLLSKVRISGGGRCNVTHAEFNPKQLTANYPRGAKELLSPFHTFQPKDTIAWFEQHGVELKTEGDGRVFPITDRSATIVNALLETAQKAGAMIRQERSVTSVEKIENGFKVCVEKQDPILCDALILATGSSSYGHQLAASLGHTIVPPVPSLFTFNTPRSDTLDLQGIAVLDAELSLKSLPYRQRGNLLLTHFGFSGPAALKLSAWAARDLSACQYHTDLIINWIPSLKIEEVYAILLSLKKLKKTKWLENEHLFDLPAKLWQRLLTLADVPFNSPVGHLPNACLKTLSQTLTASVFAIQGKTTYKSEFVTCGGVHLKEVDFKTMQSRLTPRLFFAGEILNIDGVTGGFNFQNAWTTAFVAAQEIAALERVI